MILYLVIIEDRHTDVEVIPYLDGGLAVAAARQIAKQMCRNEEDYEEQDIAN